MMPYVQQLFGVSLFSATRGSHSLTTWGDQLHPEPYLFLKLSLLSILLFQTEFNDTWLKVPVEYSQSE